MKKIKHISLVFALCLSSWSCSDFLDVRPENQILLEEFWQSGSDVDAMLMTSYRTMLEDEFIKRLILWGEVRSDNVIPNSSMKDSEKQFYNLNIATDNGNCKWSLFYEIINYCNLILHFGDQVREKDPNFTQADLDVRKAEALGIRSLCYFILAKTYRDIPISEEAIIDDTQNLQIPQVSRDSLFNYIEKDLLKAESWAMNEYSTRKETKGRITKDAIRAILADLYLWKKDYGKCIEYCDKLINATIKNTNTDIETPKYMLLESDFVSPSYYIFGEGNSSESIFELQFSNQEKTNKGLNFYYGDEGNKGTIIATPSYVESEVLYPKNDERKSDFIIAINNTISEYSVFKYLGYRMGGIGNLAIYQYKNETSNWIFYRITDIILMKAEALVQINRSDSDLKDAITLVNKTYMRANPTLLETDSLNFSDYNTASALERLVLQERQRELYLEGKRWYDLVRHSERKQSTDDLISFMMNKYTSDQTTISAKLSVMNSLYLPIHFDEMRVNKRLKQNPYYETSSSNIEKQ